MHSFVSRVIAAVQARSRERRQKTNVASREKLEEPGSPAVALWTQTGSPRTVSSKRVFLNDGVRKLEKAQKGPGET